MTGADVVAAARSHLGTKWMHQGRLPGVALDCAGLVIVVARQLRIVADAWDFNGYAREPDGSMLERCDALMTRIASPELGAVIVGSVVRRPQHMGILADYRHGGFSLIHAASDAGKVIEHRLLPQTVLRGAVMYRLPGVA